MATRLNVSRSSAASKRILQQLQPRLATHSAFTSLGPRRRLARADFEVSALAIAIPRRTYATETSTGQGSGANGPPPGFNLDEAKKPLPQTENKATSSGSTSSPSIEELKKNETISAPNAAKPSDLAPTPAVENATLSELAAAKQKQDESKTKVEKAEAAKKLTLGQRIMKEVRHYWDG
jgi:LETM1 and EF-hand domain-containing protein 1, mitochondrial